MNDELLEKKLKFYLRSEGDEYNFDSLFQKVHDKEFIQRMIRNEEKRNGKEDQKSIE